MAASDQAAELATSSLHLLENPNTEVQDAQYKHEDPETVLSAAVEDLEKEEKEEGKEKTELSARAPDDFNTSFSEAAETSISHENFLDFSAIYQSNEEYFRKLEKLKAAHMETMAKLEKMCQNKLNFNPSQPVFIREETPSDSCWRSLEEKKMLEEERNRILTKQKQRMKELQKLLINRAMAYDTHQSLAQMSKSRVKSLRKREKERMKEYWQELQEREEKLKHRPLLFERVSQKNARMAAEKHYSNTLKALGISDEFVSKKGQNGKIFESFNNQEMKSFTEDKESSNEEEIIEGENEEENYFIDSNSQESCKEKDEADEESGEGESVC